MKLRHLGAASALVLGLAVCGAATAGPLAINTGPYGSADISTGDLSYSGGAFQGWAGIQTATTNTGVASNNLAATAVSANANVNFGGANGGSR